MNKPIKPKFHTRYFAASNREALHNWLALGLLLAAWNAGDDEGRADRRPDSLRGYVEVSVRAVRRSIEQNGPLTLPCSTQHSSFR
jgi:hypothetical protein